MIRVLVFKDKNSPEEHESFFLKDDAELTLDKKEAAKISCWTNEAFELVEDRMVILNDDNTRWFLNWANSPKFAILIKFTNEINPWAENKEDYKPLIWNDFIYKEIHINEHEDKEFQEGGCFDHLKCSNMQGFIDRYIMFKGMNI